MGLKATIADNIVSVNL